MIGIHRPLAVTTLAILLLSPSACSMGLGRSGTETNEMHRRFSRSMDIQTGVVLGDLDRARDAGSWLANYEGTEVFPEGFDRYRAEIRGYASLIAQAEDLESVAAQVGEMAAACGDCHMASGGGPRFVVGSDPPDSSSGAARMVIHLWAADRMWEGLVGPSDAAWRAGADALDRGWTSSEEGVLASNGAGVAGSGYLAHIQDLGRAARQATTQQARARVYGELMGTCNGCHGSNGVMVER